MNNIEVLCPKCGNPLVLKEYGRYLSKDMRSFEHIYEGCCPKCMERLVERKNLIGSREYRVSVYFSKDMRSFEHIHEGCCPKCMKCVVGHKNLLGSREYRVSAKESKEFN
jgi:hypothetical protein